MLFVFLILSVKTPFPMKDCIVPRKEGEFCKGVHDFEKLLDFEIVNIELENCGVLLNPLAEYSSSYWCENTEQHISEICSAENFIRDNRTREVAWAPVPQKISQNIFRNIFSLFFLLDICIVNNFEFLCITCSMPSVLNNS